MSGVWQGGGSFCKWRIASTYMYMLCIDSYMYDYNYLHICIYMYMYILYICIVYTHMIHFAYTSSITFAAGFVHVVVERCLDCAYCASVR